MRLDLYQAETEQTAARYRALLEDARKKLHAGERLTPLEQNGVLHALQVIIENAIGKTKQILKSRSLPVPVSAYDAFAALAQEGIIKQSELPGWNAIVGLRNRIVHEYMNLDIDRIMELVKSDEYGFVIDYLMMPV